MKKLILAVLSAFAIATTVHATPPSFDVAPTPNPIIRPTAKILGAVDAAALIEQSKAAGNTITLNGSTVAVMPLYGMLITSGSDAGKIRVAPMLKPVTTGTSSTTGTAGH